MNNQETPFHPTTYENGYVTEGATLRDHFAGLAMQTLAGTLLYSPYNVLPDAVTAQELAAQSYTLADAMLAERNKQSLSLQTVN